MLGLVASCYSPSPALGVPCSASGACPIGQECDLLSNVCGLPTEMRLFRDDTASDFETGGPTLEGTFVEAGGFVGPMPYLVGGVRVAGIASHVIPTLTTTWDDVAAATTTGQSLARGLEIDFGDGTPWGLGLTAGDNVSVTFEGEIFLDEVGIWGLELDANDIGFLELAPPGSDAFVRVAADDNNVTTGAYLAATAGWHRFRGAFADAAMVLELAVRYDPPGPGNFRDIPDDRIRAPVGDYVGLMADGFDEGYMLLFLGSTNVTDSLAGLGLGVDPYGMPLGTTDYSVRWSGQVLIEVEGDYAFRIDSNQGHRAWIDGVNVADVFDSNARVTVTTPTRLAPGWHDLVIDVSKAFGMTEGRISVTVSSGPAWVGEGIPPENLRPVVGRGVRWTGNSNSSAVAIPDDGTAATRTISLDLPAGAIGLAIDTLVSVTHPVLTSVGVVLDPLVGSNITLAAPGSFTGAGAASTHDVIPASRAGFSFGFVATDNVVDVMTGSITSAAVTVSYRGGLAPFEPTSRFTSAPRDLGDVVRLGEMRWSIRQPMIAPTLRVRTGDTAEACAAAAWVVVADGATPSVPPRRFFQYQVELASDGDLPTSIDWVELAYIAHVEP